MSAKDARSRYGLKGQFISVAAVAVFFLVLFLAVGELAVPYYVTVRARLNSVEIAKIAAIRLDQNLRQNAAGLSSLAAQPQVTSMDPGQQTPFLAVAGSTNPEIKQMFITDVNGVVIASAPEHPSYAPGVNFGNAPYFREPLEKGNPYYSDVFIEGSDVQMIVAVPVRLADGTTAGTMSSVLSMTKGIAADYFKDLKIGKHGYAVVVDRRGTLVWHPDNERVVRQENVRGFQAVKNVVAGETGGTSGGFGDQGEITGYTHIKSAGWGILIVRPLDEAAPSLLMTRIGVALCFVFGLLLVWAFYLYGARAVIKPIRKLAEGVDSISAGEYGAGIDIKRPRELAELAESFNRLIGLTVMMSDVSKTLNTLNDMGEIEEFALRRVDYIFKAEAGAVVRFDDQGRLLIHAYRGLPAEMIEAHNARDTDMQGMVYMFGQSVVNDLGKGKNVMLETAKVKALKTMTPSDDIKFIYLFPLNINSDLEGVIMVFSSTDEVFTEERINAVDGLVEQVAAAVRRSDLYDKLYLSFAQTTKAIAKAIDAKDPFNQGHSEGVAEIAVKIAKKMGLDVEAVRGIEIAAYLHDTGKIGLSDELLNKPAQLSEEEREEIRKHPALGVSILEPIEFPWPVLGAVEHHHERYDGEGYPDSLAGERIPLEARILAVADAYESMVSDRPYRSALETEEIVKELAKESGRQFDSAVIGALLDVIQDEIKAEAADQDLSEEAIEPEAPAQEPLSGLTEAEAPQEAAEVEEDQDSAEEQKEEALPEDIDKKPAKKKKASKKK